MATSGTATFAPTILELLEEAWERATGGQELRTGYQLRTARRSFNFLTIDWQNRGYNLWTLRTSTYTTTAAVPTITLAADVMDVSGVTLTINGVDRYLQRISQPDYSMIPTKTTSGPPTQVQVTRGTGAPTLTLWPTPDQTYTITSYELRRIQDAGTGATTPDIPYRFLPAIVAGLAYYIAQKLPDAVSRIQMLQMQYEDAFEAAAEEDREKASVFIAPVRTR